MTISTTKGWTVSNIAPFLDRYRASANDFDAPGGMRAPHSGTLDEDLLTAVRS
jgi:hypothetical protein